MRFTVMLVLFVIGLFFTAGPLSATDGEMKKDEDEIKKEDKFQIGDPKEIFFSKSQMKFKEREKLESHESPKTFGDFIASVKKDFAKISEDFDLLKKEWSKEPRHTFYDPDFVPPTLPDSRKL